MNNLFVTFWLQRTDEKKKKTKNDLYFQRVVIIGPRDGNLNYNDLLTLGSDDVTLPTTFGDPSDSIASLLFSSGTTGLPKGVEIAQQDISCLVPMPCWNLH